MFEVYINKIARFLPNAPVSNDEMELFLGKIDGKESKSRRTILRNNGITQRYYALDREGNFTHTNADLCFEAVNLLFDDCFTAQDVEVLSCGTSTPDHLLPSHAAMVHGLLKNRVLELNSSSGVCCSGMNALKFGFLSVKSGNSKNAICAASERVSSWMLASRFEFEIEDLRALEEYPMLAFKKDFLRWMLSDGAGAFLLESSPHGSVSLKIEWMDSFSYAFELETCMCAGGDKLADGTLKPWSNYDSSDWLRESLFSLKQDVKLLADNILEKGVESICSTMKKHKITADDIDYFLPHLSSHYFFDALYQKFVEAGILIHKDKWFFNLSKVGNVGAASIYLMLEELMNGGSLKSGDRILLAVPESARFTYAYAYLTVV